MNAKNNVVGNEVIVVYERSTRFGAYTRHYALLFHFSMMKLSRSVDPVEGDVLKPGTDSFISIPGRLIGNLSWHFSAVSVINM